MPKLSERKRLEKKEYIIDIAFELFASKGYSATGMRDIMESANISKGGIYVYFDSKVDILMAIVGRIDMRRHCIKNQIDLSKSPEENFSHYLRSRLKAFQNEEDQKWVRIATEFWSLPKEIPELEVMLNRRYLEYEEDIKFVIKNGIDAGVFKSDLQVNEIIYQITCTIDGAGLLSGSMGDVISDKQIESTIQMYLNFIKE